MDFIERCQSLLILATFPPEGRERSARDARRINAKGDDHGKNPCTAAWAWRPANTPATPKVMTTGKTTATPKITFFAKC